MNTWSDRGLGIVLGGYEDVTSRLVGQVGWSQWRDSASASLTPGTCSFTLDNSDGGLNDLLAPGTSVNIVADASGLNAGVQSLKFDNGLLPGTLVPVMGDTADVTVTVSTERAKLGSRSLKFTFNTDGRIAAGGGSFYGRRAVWKFRMLKAQCPTITAGDEVWVYMCSYSQAGDPDAIWMSQKIDTYPTADSYIGVGRGAWAGPGSLAEYITSSYIPGQILEEGDDDEYWAVFIMFANWYPGDVQFVDTIGLHVGVSEPTISDFDDSYYEEQVAAATADGWFTGQIRSASMSWSLGSYALASVQASDLLGPLGQQELAELPASAALSAGSSYLKDWFPLTGSSWSEITRSNTESTTPLSLSNWGTPTIDNVSFASEALPFGSGSAITFLSPDNDDDGWQLTRGNVTGAGFYVKTPDDDCTLCSISYTEDNWLTVHAEDGLLKMTVDSDSTTKSTVSTGSVVADDEWHHVYVGYDDDNDKWLLSLDGATFVTYSTSSFRTGRLRLNGGNYYWVDDGTAFPSQASYAYLSVFYTLVGDPDEDQQQQWAQRMASVVPTVTQKTGTAMQLLVDIAGADLDLSRVDTGQLDCTLAKVEGKSLLDGLGMLGLDTESGRVFLDGDGRLVMSDANTATPTEVEVDSSELNSPPVVDISDQWAVDMGTVVTATHAAGSVTADPISGSPRFTVSVDTGCKDAVDAWQVAAYRATRVWPARPEIRSVTVDMLACSTSDFDVWRQLEPGDVVELTGLPDTSPTVSDLFFVEGRSVTVATGVFSLTWDLSPFEEVDVFILGTDDLSGSNGLTLA